MDDENRSNDVPEGPPEQGQVVRVFLKEGGSPVQAKYFGATYHSIAGDSHKWRQADIQKWEEAAAGKTEAFRHLIVYRHLHPALAAEGFCVRCDQERPLKVVELPAGLSITCRVCQVEQVIPNKLSSACAIDRK
jgi:hypothetical protein